MEGNDLNHLMEGNQAGLFRSMVFERLTRPYPLPQTHTSIFYIPNIKALAVVVPDRRFYHVFPRWASAKHVTIGQANFVSKGYNLNILGKGQLVILHNKYQGSRLCGFKKDFLVFPI